MLNLHSANKIIIIIVCISGCHLGQMRNLTTGECQNCPNGTFRDTTEITECTSCPEGYITVHEGSRRCFIRKKIIICYAQFKMNYLQRTIFQLYDMCKLIATLTYYTMSFGLPNNNIIHVLAFLCEIGQYYDIYDEECRICPVGMSSMTHLIL